MSFSTIMVVGRKLEAEFDIKRDKKTFEEGIKRSEEGSFSDMENLRVEGNGKDGFESESFSDSTAEHSSSSRSSSAASADETKMAALGWPIRKANVNEVSMDVPKKVNNYSEMEMMMERFAKLLLGEDMSGSGNGVCSALAISNAITNLYATVFGQLWRLEPLSPEKRLMWKREMGWLLSVSDHIVELIPSWQTFPNGNKHEVMACKPRSDLHINLPALRKLDNLILEMLDSFGETEFWYVDQGVAAAAAVAEADVPVNKRREKWWLPVPRVPSGGLTEETRKELVQKRESGSQILKAAMSINTMVLSEIDVPDSYLETLPKNGRSCLGDVIYRYITSEQFSSECLLDCLDLSNEHVALEIANRVEATVHVWRRRNQPKPVTNANRSTAKSSWEMVKDLMVDGDRRGMLADRAESLLISLKQRFPCLTQTTLDSTKILCNKDVGKSILEGYSRVLEGLAFNVVARIDDLLYVDDLTKHSDKLGGGATRRRNSASVTPTRTTYATPTLSPLSLKSSMKGVGGGGGGDRTPVLNGNANKPPRRGIGVKRVLSNYLGGESRAAKSCGNLTPAVPNRSCKPSSVSRASTDASDGI